jgi:virginiamycin B lyase
MKNNSPFIKAAIIGLGLLLLTGNIVPAQSKVSIESYPVQKGADPHDVAPDRVGAGVWYTAQNQGALGYLDPATGKTEQIPLGNRSRPHGVIVGPGGNVWITDSGLNAIVMVDPKTKKITRFPLPQASGYANLNTAAFDKAGTLWFTGQRGIYGSLDPANGKIQVFKAPRGSGPYGIDATPAGEIWYVSLAGSYLAHVENQSGKVKVIDPPEKGSGLRRVWSDSHNKLWVSGWNSGLLGKYDPQTDQWLEWKLPGSNPAAYAVYVDETDKIWLSDFTANAIVRFDPITEQFESFPIPRSHAAVRQILGRKGEVWTAESGTDRLTVYRYQ